MKRLHVAALVSVLGFGFTASAQEQHAHSHSNPPPEKLGTVTFPTSCAKSVQPRFERALALLHSFAYTASEQAFREVAEADPKCAIAHWGVAMSLYYELWEPPGAEDYLSKGAAEIERAKKAPNASPRERAFIDALAVYYADSRQVPPATRANAYAEAMAGVAARNPDDVEAQIFYALALIATAPPTDRTHANDKHAADILEPLFRRYPQHPGIAHYLIHAYDSAELAPRGLAAARAYSKIAPSAPHALHMPSHVFTRLGYWDDSIASNLAARAAAHRDGDIGEELHAMDYLTYAYLQRGREAEASRIVDEARGMSGLAANKFKIGYAANAMPVRLAIERGQWDVASKLEPLPGSEPQVAAIVYWARAIARTRGGHADDADADIAKIRACQDQLNASGNTYWATQTAVLAEAASAWQLKARGRTDEATQRLRAAADQEDAIEKRPVTPGPIVPAREQLAEMLLELDRPQDALREFQTALASAPGRRGALVGAAQAAERVGDAQMARKFRTQLSAG